jgi:aspartyl-tRNA(Asn)/glutamyl-tRNA(Gln) amidotransferase subunit A
MTEKDLDGLTITELAPQIRTQQLSPVELTELFLKRIERLNPLLNAYTTVTADVARLQAQAAESEIANGRYRGPLHGIPISVKENICIKGVRTTAGSKTLAKWVPDHDATIFERISAAGAVFLGRTNMHEWAAGGTTINPFYGTTRNPWDTSRVAAGSSGGSGAAVAASLCLASLGTDNGGSVRNPASVCGVVGLKPTFGRLSHFGGVDGSGGYSTDHFGILSKTVADCSTVLQAIAGYDPKDARCANEPVPDYSTFVGQSIGGLKIGVIEKYFDDLMVRDVRQAFDNAIERLKSLAATVEIVRIPHMELISPVWACITRAENASAHLPYLRSQPRDYSRGLLSQIVGSMLIPAGTYMTAQRVRRLICQEFDKVFTAVDAIVTPTSPMAAPTIEECEQGFVVADGKKISLRDTGVNFRSLGTAPFNVTGLPALSVCCGFTPNGLPIGLQIVGKPFDEGTVLQVAHAYEAASEWRRRRPVLPNFLDERMHAGG